MTDLVEIPKNTELVMRPLLTPKELIARQKELATMIQEGLTKGIDYGVIPGTTGGKPTLLKPGAEKLCLIYGLMADYSISDSTVDHTIEIGWENKYGKRGTAVGLYRYVYKCTLRDRTGRAVASGEGVCSSLESKYCSRPKDVENTILKMAQKRALVAATLNAFGLSGEFTQDLDDQANESQSAAARAQPAGFDPSLKTHQDWFINEMEKRGITDERWDAIAKKIKGLSKEKLKPKLDEIINAQENPAEIVASDDLESIPSLDFKS